MDTFFRTSAGVLVAVILALTLEKQSKDVAMLLTAFVCCMVAVVATSFFQPVVTFLQSLLSIGALSSASLAPLLKITGIALVTQIASMVCADAGSNALAKALEFLGSAVILSLSIPIFNTLLQLVQKILGEV